MSSVVPKTTLDKLNNMEWSVMLEIKELITECGGYHQFCTEMSVCPWCDYKLPLRYTNGQFAPYSAVLLEMNQHNADHPAQN